MIKKKNIMKWLVLVIDSDRLCCVLSRRKIQKTYSRQHYINITAAAFVLPINAP